VEKGEGKIHLSVLLSQELQLTGRIGLLVRKVLFLVEMLVREMVQKAVVQLAGAGAQARRRHRQWCVSGNNGGWVASLRATWATLVGCSSGGHGCRRNATPQGYLFEAS
jgi:hypothetical protein